MPSDPTLLESPQPARQAGDGRARFVPDLRIAWPSSLFIILAVITAIDALWASRMGLAFVGWQPPLIGVIVLLLVWRICAARSLPAIAEMPYYTALWIALSAVAVINSYLAAALSLPAQDALLAACDRAMGFGWFRWRDTLRAYPAAQLVLTVAYFSMMAQVALSIVVFALAKIPRRNEEFLTAAAISMALTIPWFALMPAIGPSTEFAYVPVLTALRAGTPAVYVLGEMQGIVCIPSYHTVLALLLIHVHRGVRWTFPPVVVLNVLMIVSIPSVGGHYLVDLAGGAVVTLVTLGIMRATGRY